MWAAFLVCWTRVIDRKSCRSSTVFLKLSTTGTFGFLRCQFSRFIFFDFMNLYKFLKEILVFYYSKRPIFSLIYDFINVFKRKFKQCLFSAKTRSIFPSDQSVSRAALPAGLHHSRPVEGVPLLHRSVLCPIERPLDHCLPLSGLSHESPRIQSHHAADAS